MMLKICSVIFLIGFLLVNSSDAGRNHDQGKKSIFREVKLEKSILLSNNAIFQQESKDKFLLSSSLGSSDICLLKAETGPCRAAKQRWAYFSASGRCETFTYGGCEGNENNFFTEQDCIDKCAKTGKYSGSKDSGHRGHPGQVILVIITLGAISAFRFMRS